MKKSVAVLFLIKVFVFTPFAQSQNKWPLPSAQDTFNLGVNIQRTMSRLEKTNHGGHKDKISILFYGQSFVKQAYWLDIVDHLRAKYPLANLDVRNRAIGGFTNKYLLQTSKIDVIPFYPDLILYQAQGSPYSLDSTIQQIRTNTTSEIVLMNSVWKERDEKEPAIGWSEEYGHTHIPTIATKYGCGYIDTRTLWHKYLNEYGLDVMDVLDETRHMNEYGVFLHGELVKPYFKFQPHHLIDNRSGVIKTLTSDDLKIQNDIISFKACGNRIELFFEEQIPEDFIAEIYIDKKRPSEFKGNFAVSRPNGADSLDWPWETYAFFNVEWNELPVEEHWTLTVTESGEKSQWVKFEISGSETGFDGFGDSREVFISKSGRVVIQPDWWHLKRSHEFMYAREEYKAMTAGRIASDKKETALPIMPGYAFKWFVKSLGNDRIDYLQIKQGRGAVVIAQGIPNGDHLVEIRTSNKFAEFIKKVKVFQPPLAISNEQNER